LKDFKVIAFTHKNFDVSHIGNLHIEPDYQEYRLRQVKAQLQIEELMFLSTCNRVEYLLVFDGVINSVFLEQFFFDLYPLIEEDLRNVFIHAAQVFEGEEAIEHTLRVASSIDSMVVGEREIITQVRSSYENCKRMGLTGDFIRLLMRHTIETAKKVYTHTSISTKPVSVVSLAFHRLQELSPALNSRIVLIGSGVTNTSMARFLFKHGFTNFTVFNRTLENGKKLAEEIKGKALPLSDLTHYKEGFDILITCTGSEDHIISPFIYEQLLQDDEDRKIVIDLAIPYDLDPSVPELFPVKHISVDDLRLVSESNLKERTKEIAHVEKILFDELAQFSHIYKLRQVELAMRDVPMKVKDIKATAKTVFARELETLDPAAQEVLENMLNFIEKKYMSVPMKMAKEILIKG
jgi:glutamyl-tRNA reductase